MVDARAVKAALLTSGGIFALLFVGTVLRFVSRIVSFALLGLFVVAAAYVTYELYTGWHRGDGETSDEFEPGNSAVNAVTGSGSTDRASDGLTDQDVDKELESLKSDVDDQPRDADVELDH